MSKPSLCNALEYLDSALPAVRTRSNHVLAIKIFMSILKLRLNYTHTIGNGYRNPNARRPAPICSCHLVYLKTIASSNNETNPSSITSSAPVAPTNPLNKAHQTTSQRRSALQVLILLIPSDLILIPITISLRRLRYRMSMRMTMSLVLVAVVVSVVVVSIPVLALPGIVVR